MSQQVPTTPGHPHHLYLRPIEGYSSTHSSHDVSLNYPFYHCRRRYLARPWSTAHQRNVFMSSRQVEERRGVCRGTRPRTDSYSTREDSSVKFRTPLVSFWNNFPTPNRSPGWNQDHPVYPVSSPSPFYPNSPLTTSFSSVVLETLDKSHHRA